MTAPHLSVVIPSYNGAKRLPNVLNALATQSYLDAEVIVVLDGSTDDSKAVIEGLTLPFSPKIIEKENGGRASARNAGAKTALGKVLLFIDDDMRPTEEVLASHLAFHESHPGAALVGAQLSQPHRIGDDIEKYQVRNEQRFLVGTPMELYRMPPELQYITASHFSIDQALFWQHQGFDAQLTDLEDYDLAVRMQQAGEQLWRDERITAWHDSWESATKITQRQRAYTQALQRLHSLKPEQMKDTIITPPPPLSFPRKILMSILARRFFLRRIGKAPLKWLPAGLRFAVYDYIIYGLANYFPHRPIE